MSYKTILLLLSFTCVFAAPVSQEVFEYRYVDCIEGSNKITPKYIIEVENFNETCIQVNKTSEGNNEIFLYVITTPEPITHIQIPVESCSTTVPLPDIYLTKCDDERNNTNIITNVNMTNVTDYLEPTNETSTEFQTAEDHVPTGETFIYTGPTVFETLHQLDENNNDQQTTVATSYTITTEAIDLSVEE